MKFAVFLTEDATRDLEEIYDYIARYDGVTKAHYVLDRLEEVVGDLTRFPRRGPYPRELLELGIQEYREVFFKPYRVIYRVAARRVYIYLIADGRRDMQTLLVRRLVGT